MNLRAITGPNTAEQTNYYHDLSYEEAAAELEQLATENCAGTMTVIKSTVPRGTPPGSTVDELDEVATPAGDWQLTASTSTEGVTFGNGSTTQTKSTETGTGAASYKMTFNTEEDAAVTVTEILRPGYTHFPVGTGDDARNAVCEGRTAGDPDSEWGLVAVTDIDGANPGFALDAPPPFMVACHLYNEEPGREASIEVDKKWVVSDNGVRTSYPHGQQPDELQATLDLDGSTPGDGQGFNTVIPGYAAGDEVTIGEQLSISATGCTVRGSEITAVDGSPVEPVPIGDGYDAELHAGTNVYELTNTVDCTTRLALFKQVNGSVAPGNWMLTAQPMGDGASGALPGPSGAQQGTLPGTTGVSADVTADFSYALREEPVPNADPAAANYQQLPPTDAALAPPEASGRWYCRVLNADGTFPMGEPDTIGGQNGVISVSLGQSIGCLTVNSTASLTLRKEVVNQPGGDAEPADWTLTATPLAPDGGELPPGVGPQSVAGSADGVTIEVYPDVEYEITESGGPAGYAQTSAECVIDSEEPLRQATSVAVGAQRSAVCTLTNVQADDGVLIGKAVRSVERATDGTWTVAYTITVTNRGPSGRVYSLDDTLRYGEGISLDTATLTWRGGGTDGGTVESPDIGDTVTLATDRFIPGSATHGYLVTITGITVPEHTGSEARECPSPGSTARGAFNNEAGLVVEQRTVATACAEPAGPQPTPPPDQPGPPEAPDQPGGPGLPGTGVSIAEPIALGLALVAAGVLFVLLGRGGRGRVSSAGGRAAGR